MAGSVSLTPWGRETTLAEKHDPFAPSEGDLLLFAFGDGSGATRGALVILNVKVETSLVYGLRGRAVGSLNSLGQILSSWPLCPNLAR